MATAYIGIGSNLGEKLNNCKKACNYISTLHSTKILATSKWYENEALTSSPHEKQPGFINGAIKIKTDLEPVTLLSKLKEIEIKMGRGKNNRKWVPRLIDLDIIFYDNIVLDTDILKIPHPEGSKRIFVLKPLCDIEPKLVHPVLSVTLEHLLKALKESLN